MTDAEALISRFIVLILEILFIVLSVCNNN